VKTYPSIENAKTATGKLGPLSKNTCGTRPSVRPFHSAKFVRTKSYVSWLNSRGLTVEAEKQEQNQTNG